MLTYSHPGVYVQELSTLPPSVAPVATAIPVFIGYTQQGPTTPTRIDTMLDYVTLFGGAYPKSFSVQIDESQPPSSPSYLTITPVKTTDTFLMYYGLSLYFQNGGGTCYILSVGNYLDNTSGTAITPSKADFEAALEILKKEDEPTLIVLLDATALSNNDDYYDLCSQARDQCKLLGDRFLIVDVPYNTDIIADAKTFRNSSIFGSNYLSYAAAYYPYLNTALSYIYNENQVTIVDNSATFTWSPASPSSFTVSYIGIESDTPTVTITVSTLSPAPSNCMFDTNTPTVLNITLPNDTTTVKALSTDWNTWKNQKGNNPSGFDITNIIDSDPVATTDNAKLINVTFPTTFSGASDPNGFTVTYISKYSDNPTVTITTGNKFSFDTTSTPNTLAITIPSNTAATALVSAWIQQYQENPAGFKLAVNGNGTSIITANSSPTLKLANTTLATLNGNNTVHYNQIKTALANQTITLPPSPAIAGVYASVDRDRGVWKAPANVSLNGVIGPVTKISDNDQDGLNIDPTGAGKSINAIRSFTGKGTLVWGARTLAGDDNEWRYVPVRRLFIFIEESTRKATSFAVFEPNDATTWLKVKAMIESFLYGLWQQGALAGSKPDQAYFVNIGLGKSMTAQDILEGRMIVNIGVAAVRPAEFIILTFSHKMQEA